MDAAGVHRVGFGKMTVAEHALSVRGGVAGSPAARALPERAAGPVGYLFWSKIGMKPPKTMRLPSKGMSAPISFMRGSLRIFSLAASRTSFDGYSIHEKTTVSPSWAFTAR